MAKRDDVMHGDDQVITRKILREELADFVTKAELRTQLATFTDAVIARMDAGFSTLEHRLHIDIASWTRAIEEKTAATLRVLDDKYGSLPPRVSRLEAKVFAPRRKRGRP
jgi:hypothetical protein